MTFHISDPLSADTTGQEPKRRLRTAGTDYVSVLVSKKGQFVGEPTGTMWAKTKGMAFNSGKALGSAMTHGTRAASISFLILMKLYLEPGFGKALAIVL